MEQVKAEKIRRLIDVFISLGEQHGSSVIWELKDIAEQSEIAPEELFNEVNHEGLLIDMQELGLVHTHIGAVCYWSPDLRELYNVNI